MFLKVIFVVTVAAVASAQLSRYFGDNQYNQGHEHQQAVSTQNIVLHQSQGQQSHQPAHYSGYEAHQDSHAAPQYAFEYSVHDTHTGDIKSQHETSDGDVVHGFYSLHEPDGTIRRVDYTADKHSGFQAIVRREGHAIHEPSHQTHEAPVHHH